MPFIVLDRNDGEAIKIGDDVTIVCLSLKGVEAKLGILAPKSINIVRVEIADEALIEKVGHLLPPQVKR